MEPESALDRDANQEPKLPRRPQTPLSPAAERIWELYGNKKIICRDAISRSSSHSAEGKLKGVYDTANGGLILELSSGSEQKKVLNFAHIAEISEI